MRFPSLCQSPQDAQDLEERGNWQSAEEIWRKLAAQAPGDYRLWTSLGIALAHEDKFDAAIAAYLKALSLKPNNPQVELNLGIAYFKAGKLPQAVDPLRSAAAQLPGNPQVETLLGMTLFGTGHYKEAIPYLERTRTREPQNSALERVLAQSYLEAGEYPKALAEFKEMLERDPDSAAVHMLLGEAYDAQGEPDKAIAEFRTATEKSYVPDAHFGLGYLFWKTRRYDEAKIEFQRELEHDPKHSQALMYLGDIALKQGDGQQAAALLHKATALKDNSRLAYLDLGILETQEKQYAAAERDLKQAANLDPKKPDAYYRLARVYQATGQTAEADRELARVKQLHEQTREDDLLKVSGAPGKPQPQQALPQN
ncbi:MAG: tetratricopeptide repeat protein [Acidobacteriaceae bacterium]|nr:tetratricopeptide repeat protein [Acidobacteriaceae bacterium]